MRKLASLTVALAAVALLTLLFAAPVLALALSW